MFGAICFHSALILEQGNTLELYQKKILGIILATDSKNYSHARSVTNISELEMLRKEACLKWALKGQVNPQYKHMFPLNDSTTNTRHRKAFREHHCKGAKYFNSAVPYMTTALNRKKKQLGNTRFNTT